MFLEVMKKSERGGWTVENTGVYLWSLYQSPFMNKRSLTEATELYRTGKAPEAIFRQLDFVAKNEIVKRKKNIEKRNIKSLVPKILRDVPVEPDLLG